jgi:hypothetical protein
MRSTRATVDLKSTSIQAHLLEHKGMNTSSIHRDHDIQIDENKDLSMKPVNELMTSTFLDNNNQQKPLPTPLPVNQDTMMATPNETYQQRSENEIKLSATGSQQATAEIPFFSGNKEEDPGQWLDYVFTIIEQRQLTPSEQRDIAAARLTGEALLWYRLNRLKIPDMQSFIHHFLLTYRPAHGEAEQLYGGTSKSIIEQNQYFEPSSRSTSPVQVLKSARNEKVKLFPHFSGAENSLNWLKNLQQIGKALKLDDQQIFELAIIKLSGPAQEWFYHQDDEIDNWSSFKQAFLHAFPPPIQPTNIDYLAQLLARKQGETEPVGKFVQDINRLCLKLDGKINEQDKLQYLRRGLRPQLQHYALSITSLQEFLSIMQRHEQIEKEKNASQPSSFKSLSKPNQQQSWFNQFKQNEQVDQQNQVSTKYKSSDHFQQKNSHPETTTQRFEKDYRICYQCNKRGHIQWNCPDNNSSQQQQQQQLEQSQQYQHQQQPEYLQQYQHHQHQYQQQDQHQGPQQNQHQFQQHWQQNQQQHPHQHQQQQFQQQHFQQRGH